MDKNENALFEPNFQNSYQYKSVIERKSQLTWQLVSVYWGDGNQSSIVD